MSADIETGDRAVIVKTADGVSVPAKVFRLANSGEKGIICKTADVVEVPMLLTEEGEGGNSRSNIGNDFNSGSMADPGGTITTTSAWKSLYYTTGSVEAGVKYYIGFRTLSTSLRFKGETYLVSGDQDVSTKLNTFLDFADSSDSWLFSVEFPEIEFNGKLENGVIFYVEAVWGGGSLVTNDVGTALITEAATLGGTQSKFRYRHIWERSSSFTTYRYSQINGLRVRCGISEGESSSIKEGDRGIVTKTADGINVFRKIGKVVEYDANRGTIPAGTYSASLTNPAATTNTINIDIDLEDPVTIPAWSGTTNKAVFSLVIESGFQLLASVELGAGDAGTFLGVTCVAALLDSGGSVISESMVSGAFFGSTLADEPDYMTVTFPRETVMSFYDVSVSDQDAHKIRFEFNIQGGTANESIVSASVEFSNDASILITRDLRKLVV